MTQFSAAGLNGTFWTLSKFLSKRPIKNIIGIIETPSNPASPTVNIPGTSETAMPGATATPGEAATPSASPTALISGCRSGAQVDSACCCLGVEAANLPGSRE